MSAKTETDPLASKETSPFFNAVQGDCPDFRGEVRENGTVPLGRSGGRRIFRRETARKTSPSPACERFLRGAVVALGCPSG